MRLANVTKESYSMNFQETSFVAFLGHTDATETTKDVVKVTQVFLQCKKLG